MGRMVNGPATDRLRGYWGKEVNRDTTAIVAQNTIWVKHDQAANGTARTSDVPTFGVVAANRQVLTKRSRPSVEAANRRQHAVRSARS
jgi:hypothetical protein